jgi:hypothetical protein
MPGFLSRSKSMRLLRGNRRDAQSEHGQSSMPRVGASQTDVDRYRSATPNVKGRHLETSDIAVRPSTSGGPVDRKTLFHMKTNPVPSVHSQNDLAFSLHSGSITTFYTAEVTDSSDGIIGIALGSPSLGSDWTSTPQAANFDTDSRDTDGMSTFTRPDSPSSFPVRQQPPKSKLTRWKSMFRKAAPPPPPPDKPSFYQLAQNVTATKAIRADSHQDDDSVKSHAEVEDERRKGGTPSPPAFKTNIRASRTFPAARTASERPLSRARAYTAGSLPANPRVSVVRSVTNPLPPSKLVQDYPAPPKLLATQSTRTLPILSGDKPLLDVSIPDIKLDRYSVMFNNLLQPTSDRSSSLLVRRQGNAEKLKPLNKLTVKVSNTSLHGLKFKLKREQENLKESPMDYRLQRRATSPVVPSPSPRLSLFPNTTSSRAASPAPRLGTAPLPKGLYRSKTERSPLHQTFSRAESDWNKAQELFVRKPATTNIVPSLKSSASVNLTVQKLSVTPTSATSFDSDTDSITLVVGRTASGVPTKLHLDDREPEWEICAKPAAPTRSHTTPVSTLRRADSKAQPTVTKLSALSSHPSSAPLEAPSPLQRIQQLQSPPLSAQPQVQTKADSAPRAMVGVARSVSVSRAGSPRTLVRMGSELKSPGDRLMEHRALTPTMVKVKNRQSQRVQLVDA